MFKQHAHNLIQTPISPAILEILPEHVYSHTNPIIVGVRVEGSLYLGAPLVIPSRKWLEIGKVAAIRTFETSTPITVAENGSHVIVKIEQQEKTSNRNIMYNREFDFSNKLYVKLPNTLPPHLRKPTEAWLKAYLRVFGFLNKQQT